LGLSAVDGRMEREAVEGLTMFEVIWDSLGCIHWEWVRLWTDAEGLTVPKDGWD